MAKNVIKKHLAWIVGNGERISFWFDNWCCGHFLRSLFIGPLPNQWDSWRVAIAIREDGQWNTDLLQDCLPPLLVDFIHSIPLSLTQNLVDTPYWPHQSGECTVNNAYHMISHLEPNRQTDPSSMVLAMAHVITPNLIILLWKVLHSRLATRDNLP